jgi:hypothetical protein
MSGSQLGSFIWEEVPVAIRIVDRTSPELLHYPFVPHSRVGIEEGNMIISFTFSYSDLFLLTLCRCRGLLLPFITLSNIPSP